MSARFDYKKTIVGSDCNPKLILSTGMAMTLLADCEHMQIHHDKFVSDYLNANNYAWFISARSVEIVSLPRFMDEVRITTAMYEINTLTGNRNTFIYDKDGKVLIKSNAFGVLVDLASGRAIRSDAFKDYKLHENLGFSALSRKIEYDRETGIKVDHIIMPKYFLDHYDHVNNANYVKLATEYLDREFDKGIIRVEFRAAAKNGDSVEVFVYEEKNRTVVDLRSSNEKSYCLIEFSK